VVRSLESITKESNVYYYKLEKGKYISLIDTPGLSDTMKLKNPEIDNIHLEQIQKVISRYNIRIKGILFLVNFQNERFDANEQETLLKYYQIFPLKRFWKNIIIIFTHYYHDPDGDDENEMKEARDKSNWEFFKNLLENLKDVSDVINYKDLNIKYFNSFCPIKKPSHKKKNILVRNELEIELVKLMSYLPLFLKIEIITITDFKIEDKVTNKKFLTKIELIWLLI